MRLAGWVFCLACVLYAGTCAHPFSIYDDPLNVTANPYLQPVRPAGVARFWLAPYEGLYAPVSYMVYMLLALLGGIDPRLFHAANVLLHACTTTLIFGLLRRLGMPDRAALFGAVVFAVHPLQVESVAWVTETRGLLAGCFGLAALVVYASPRLDRRTYAAATALFVAALLSKPTAAAVPLVAGVIDVAWLKRDLGRSLRRLLPWGAMVVVLAVITSSEQVGSQGSATAPLLSRPLVALDAIAHYVGKIAWPLQLGPDYGRSPAWLLAEGHHAWPAGTTALALLLLAVVPAARSWLPTAALFIAGLAPSLGFAPFAFQVHSTVADRFAYLAMPAVALAAARLFAVRSVAVRVVLLAVCLAWAVLGVRQMRFWRSDVALFTHALAVNPTSRLALNNLGIALTEEQRFAEAIARLEAAVKLDPAFADARNSLGQARRKSGDAAGAVGDFQQAVALAPDDLRIRNNLGEALASCGRWSEAAEQFAAVLARQPGFSNVQLNLARALRNLGRMAEALEHARAACQIEPTYAEARREYGELLLTAGQLDDARHELTEAVRLAPGDAAARLSLAAVHFAADDDRAAAREYEALLALPETTLHRRARNNLAWLLATSADPQLRDGPRAVALAEALPPERTAGELDTLAAAYAAAGNFDRAIALARDALAKAGDRADVAEKIRTRIARYEAGQPWIE